MIAVITPTLPERLELLTEAILCVRGQTKRPFIHLIGFDYEKGHMAVFRNAMAQAARDLGCDKLAFYDDDDLINANHLELLDSVDADAVYSFGFDKHHDRAELNREFDPEYLKKHNYIACNLMVKTSAFFSIGGFKDMQNGEEWDFWKRLAASGADIKCLPEVTWEYRRSSKR
jgi:hypothetical protein